MFKKYFASQVGFLRFVTFLEGMSLLILVLVAVPLKYFFDNPAMVKALGPIHGVLFVLFCFGSFTSKLIARMVIF